MKFVISICFGWTMKPVQFVNANYPSHESTSVNCGEGQRNHADFC